MNAPNPSPKREPATSGAVSRVDGAPMGHRTAIALAFGSSAAVLIVEIAALRLLAPYLGLTLETSTLVIGIALAAIALGSWGGGRVADVVDARRLIGPALGFSGAAVALTPALLRLVGGSAPGGLLPAAAALILVPGALLAAVTPMVTTLRLDRIERTGTVVGQLSGAGTLGAITGTVLTGFVLISRVPVSAILIGLGAVLVVASLPWLWTARTLGGAAAMALAVGAGGLAVLVAPGECEVETKYHCANVLESTGTAENTTTTARSDGRTLVLDGLRHSYVDLADPTRLEFTYVRAMASVIDTLYPQGEAIRAYHLGGGGLTIPRYLATVRPGTDSLVSEIDGGVVDIDRESLGLDELPEIQVHVEDGRLGLRHQAAGSRQVVVGDAFGGVSVPWHLTTREALTDVRRVLTDDGAYVANLIDYGTLAFARAELATLAEVFDHVYLAGKPVDIGVGAGRPVGGNLVVVATDRTLDVSAIQEAMDRRDTGWRIIAGDDVDAWIGKAQILTDDFAPVDQLLQPFRSSRR